ncbi:hypothetical protein D3C76_1007010 [compost metagenome]
MAQGGHHSGKHQHVVVTGYRAKQVTDNENAHQRYQGGLARQPGGGQCHEWRTNGHAQGVTGYQPAGAGDRHTEVGRHIGQQAHDDELGGADGEGA